ncbi:MAG: topoisomerase C-terminal repeat-containing protein, partial [Candidatus Puniceispirillaceae bacterium]
YVEHNKLRAPVPRGTDMAEITLEQSLAWLAEKAARPAKKKSAKRSATKKKAAPKSAAKKKAAKKSTSA